MTTPWFKRSRTKQAISDISGSESLLVYAGAGVSIDRTGLGWSELSEHLLQRAGLSESLAKKITNDLPPDAAASSAFGLIERNHGDRTSKYVADELRPLLGHRRLVGGNACRAIATLGIRLARQGRRFQVATTNYDDYLLQDATDELSSASMRGQPVPSLVLHDLLGRSRIPIEPTREGSPELEYTYLHGVLRESQGSAALPVISEAQYCASEGATADWLETKLECCDLLVVGSSLRDRPLLRALAQSASAARDKGLKRQALLPLPSILTPETLGLEGDELHEYLNTVQARMEQFNVDLLFPDYFGQVAQYLIEVAVATANPVVEYKASEIRYGQRLLQWWNRWSADLSNEFDQRQTDAHSIVLQKLEEVRTLLDCPDVELLKLEAWLRWEPGDSRELRLWASSVGPTSDPRLLRAASIKRESRIVAVRAFQHGQTQYVPPPYEYVDRDGRWKSYIAVPLQSEELEIPVGALVLASSHAGKHSSLRSDNRSRHHAAVTSIRDGLGAQLLGSGSGLI